MQKLPDYVIGRAYLAGVFVTVPAGDPKAVILLNSAPPGKNREFCKAFVEGLPSVEAFKKYTTTKIIPTYWILTRDLPPASLKNCETLLSNYDFEQAQALMAMYGRPDSKGPVMVAVDPDQNFLSIDFTKANAKDMRKVLVSWFQGPPLDAHVTSKTIWDRIKPTVCAMTTSTVAELGKSNPDPSKPDTFFDFTANIFKNVNLLAIGSILIGKTFNAALCAPPATPQT